MSNTDLASMFPDDPGSARNGGESWLGQTRHLVPEFEAAAYNLEPSQISPILETEFALSYHSATRIARKYYSCRAYTDQNLRSNNKTLTWPKTN
ncbi:MAG: peptidylprolyl isomerase [Saprospiraceae bacterium]|nr:peptidylprolyl isomerase [Saprospiraceae bacterium]